MRSLVLTIVLLPPWLTVPSLAGAGPPQDDAAKTLKAYYGGQKGIEYAPGDGTR